MSDLTVTSKVATTARAALRHLRGQIVAPDSLAEIDAAIAALTDGSPKRSTRASRWTPIEFGWLGEDKRISVHENMLSIELLPGDTRETSVWLPDDLRLCRKRGNVPQWSPLEAWLQSTRRIAMLDYQSTTETYCCHLQWDGIATAPTLAAAIEAALKQVEDTPNA